MITREEILSIEEYCAEHKVSHKKRLEELEIPFWHFYKAKKKYRKEDERDSLSGQFPVIIWQICPSHNATGPYTRKIQQTVQACRGENRELSYNRTSDPYRHGHTYPRCNNSRSFEGTNLCRQCSAWITQCAIGYTTSR